MMKKILIVFVTVFSLSCQAQKTLTTDVLVIGGGTGGTSAGIQSARLGARTIIVEGTPWLGGMISAAGVSAIDGNHRLPSGMWAEFRSQLYKRYGGPEAVETGWVSNTLFEPHVADSIFKSMAAAEKNLTLFFNHAFTNVTKKDNRLEAVTFTNKANGKTLTIQAKTFIDATELGDVMKATGIPYDLGMEAGALTDEKVGVNETNEIVQDLTYVAILKDYGKGADKSIPKPANYDPAEFDAACTDYYKDKTRKAPAVDAAKMLEYGKLPNNKYMLNWPLYGNDTYLNVVEMTEAEREKELVKAKETTKRFIYFIQQQLGFKHLGLADDEFPTKDRFALIPYHREGRRVKGLVRFTMRNIAEPFTYGDPLYRTGISVGDYPIDHHHKKNLSAPQHLEFYPIPSYNVPLGTLIPQNFENLIIAEKGISVSNVVNGTTRLQPCVLLTGQAAGTLAALSAKQSAALQKIPVRSVQQALLRAGAYLMPYIDVTPENPFFEVIQKVGATGILKGAGVPYKWANQTWFYPDQPLSQFDLVEGLRPYYPALENYLDASGEMLTLNSILKIFDAVGVKLSAEKVKADWPRKQLVMEADKMLNRKSIAWLVDRYLQPFERPVNMKGEVQ
ncbi:MAG TPA: FAD-dependent oxidoreductase [Flavisolibacter sp.]|jgi:hypothetical protein|nr:FAD-dependent oxidoreductase [Flavisolibacter sp.]